LFKYTLIISQFYHSRHCFIVKHDENFIETAKKFALELIQHKRFRETDRPPSIGDLEYATDKIRPRYNVNDQGDIYFIQSDYANYLMDVTHDYVRDSIRESRGYQSKEVTGQISKHHFSKDVTAIVKKYFELA
jgi:hypothetical protein